MRTEGIEPIHAYSTVSGQPVHAKADTRSTRFRTLQIDPGKPWQNGSNESLNGTFRRECLDAEIFSTFHEAKIVIAAWRRRYNRKRPHSSLGYITPEMAYFANRRP
jgi:transposase InsO family protein